MSAYLSFVSWRMVPALRSSRYRSLMPPAWPENARFLPSGDHDTELTAPMPGSLMRRSTLVDFVSRIAISLLPSAYTTNANLSPLGLQSPAELMKLIASKWGSLDGPP